MGMLKIINQATDLHQNITESGIGGAIDLSSAKVFSAQILTNVESIDPAVIHAGAAASLVVQDLTYTATTRGAGGNAYTVRYLNNTPGGPVTVQVNNGNITVNMDATVITGSTATAIKAVLDVTAGFTAIATVAVTGTGSNVQAAQIQTPFAGGVESEVDVGADTFFVSDSLRYATGLVGQWTSTGTLPGGLSTATDYWVIREDTDSPYFQVAASSVDAQMGIFINITNQGSAGAVHTFTPAALSGGMVLVQGNNDPAGDFSEWVTLSSTNVTTSSSFFVNIVDPAPRFVRVGAVVTTGQFSFIATTTVKGYV